MNKITCSSSSDNESESVSNTKAFRFLEGVSEETNFGVSDRVSSIISIILSILISSREVDGLLEAEDDKILEISRGGSSFLGRFR